MIHYLINEKRNTSEYPKFLDADHVRRARDFHQSLATYAVTPLAKLEAYAQKLGVAGVFVKDESFRYGLNAFKALGALYACYKVIEAERDKRPLSDITLVTATDGNHGRAVAYAAQTLGCKAVVYMPKGSSLYRLGAIKSHGAEAEILEMNYDDAVRYANAMAQKNGWIIVQDTAWEGYEEIPNNITKGYTTMSDEALEQLDALGIQKPTHVFLQAGVGSMAGGVLGHLVNRFPVDPPKVIILETDQADCLYRSMVIGDGKPHAVTGDLNTIMSGLACGEPNTITFEILKNFATGFLSCADDVARIGMRRLAHPEGNDPVVVSGESGAVGVGALDLIMTDPAYHDLKAALGLNEKSIVLLFSTEGDTDPEAYQEIIRG